MNEGSNPPPSLTIFANSRMMLAVSRWTNRDPTKNGKPTYL